MDVTKDNFSEVADKFEVFVTCTVAWSRVDSLNAGAMTDLPPHHSASQ